MIKAIFFDFWGTLVENGVFPSPVRQVKRIMNLHKTTFSEYILIFEKAFMTKEYDDLYQAFEGVCKAFKIRPDSRMLDELVGMWNKNKLLAKPYPETIEVLEELKKDYKLVLISNTDCFSVKSVLDKYKLEQYFDEIVLSYEVGMLKSDSKMFEQTLKKLKLKKEEVVMVGDSMESDVLGAKNADIKPILVDRRGRRDYPDKMADLTQLKTYVEG